MGIHQAARFARGYVGKTLEVGGRAVRVETARKVEKSSVVGSGFDEAEALLARVANDAVFQPLSECLRDGEVSIEPDLATRLLTEAYYTGQGNRHKTPSARVHILAQAANMRRGHFMGRSSVISICAVHGKYYVVDGYHRLASIVEYGHPVLIRVNIIPSMDMDEVAAHYSIFNRQTRPRTKAQIRGCYPVFSDDTIVSKSLQDALIRSVYAILSGFSNLGGRNLPPEMKTDEFEFTQAREWVPACELYQEAINGKSYRGGINRRFYNPAVVGMAVITLRYAPDLASRFWLGVFNNIGLPEDDPRRVLHESIDKRNDAPSKTTFGMASMVESAWRKWLAGEPASILRISKGDAVINEVARTPYKPVLRP